MSAKVSVRGGEIAARSVMPARSSAHSAGLVVMVLAE